MKTSRDNYSLGNAGLAEGTNANTFKTTSIVHFNLNGRSYSKAVTDNLALTLKTEVPALTAFVLAASQVGVMFLQIDVNGTFYYKPAREGIKPSITGTSYVPGAFEWPGDDAAYVTIGAIKIVTNASGAFTPASTDLGAANQTVTYYNCADDLGTPIPY